jgi:hypothetical protein
MQVQTIEDAKRILEETTRLSTVNKDAETGHTFVTTVVSKADYIKALNMVVGAALKAPTL